MIIKNFVLGLFAILVLSGFAAAKVAGACRLDEVTMTGTDGKTSKFTQPSHQRAVYKECPGHGADPSQLTTGHG